MRIISLILLVWSLQEEIDIHPKVTFSIYNAGIKVTGTIDSVRSIINFDPLDLSKNTIEAWADAATVTTGIVIRDKHLKRKDYFDTETYPMIHLKSKSFKKAGRNKFTGDFDLTIKGITRSVPITFTILTSDGHSSYKGTFCVNRLDFNVGAESAILGNSVKVVVRID